MRRSDWMLLFLTAGSGGPLDPVRVQKGLFLLAMEGGLPAGQTYDFEPYAYGPMSRELYRDIRRLTSAGDISGTAVPGATWELLQATAIGSVRADALREKVPSGAVATLARIRERVAALDFAALLEHVYARYPEYATHSVFRRKPR